jgi:hypothetical protein
VNSSCGVWLLSWWKRGGKVNFENLEKMEKTAKIGDTLDYLTTKEFAPNQLPIDYVVKSLIVLLTITVSWIKIGKYSRL